MTTVYENCDCCQETPSCPCSTACPCTDPPLVVTVTMAGWANAACGSCAELNDAFTLDQEFNDCHWEKDLAALTCGDIIRIEVNVGRSVVNYTGPPASCECCVWVQCLIVFATGVVFYGGATDFAGEGRIACTTNGSQDDVACEGDYDLGFSFVAGSPSTTCDYSTVTVNVVI